MEPVRLEVPAPLYDAALAFCNARLAEGGKPAIDALPAGLGCEPTSCPCANACGVRVWGKTWDSSPEWANYVDLQTKGLVRDGAPGDFVRFFDAGAGANVLTLPIRKEP